MTESRITERIRHLDTSLFAAIHSQSKDTDRRSLLAIQSAVGDYFHTYDYLEIGSHLGGSIQPYLLDPRCQRIISIDPRPAEQPDDRRPGYVARYENNSTARMLELLSAVDPKAVEKISCYEMTASEVEPASLDCRPAVIFIDGEHTERAVLSDFDFCRRVVDDSGVVVFHDCQIVEPAITKIEISLREQGRRFVGLRMEGSVYALFFDVKLLKQHPLIWKLHVAERKRSRSAQLRKFARQALPAEILEWTRRIRGFK